MRVTGTRQAGRALMVQGTGSNVGKSVIVAGLCRLARRRGIDVAPFKPQNMSNNAAVCPDGGEIGRAQALQARAAGLTPHVDHNPVLLKPESDRGARVIVHGRVAGALQARDYRARREALLAPVLESFARLVRRHALVLVEGAGSPAEVNLRAGDIANMGFASAVDVPVVLLADIDRGGVIASLVGTREVLAPDDARRIVAFAVNRFRGDPALFEDGVRFVTQRTGWPCLGVIPWLAAPARLPAEDAVDVEAGVADATGAGGPANDIGTPRTARPVRIAVPMLSRLANFDDLDPLRAEPAVDLRFVPPGRPLPRDADVVILLGTKSTLADLRMLQAQGWHHDVMAHVRAGGHLLGLCGGFQMLGEMVSDPDGVDGTPGEAPGLGLLAMRTVMTTQKTVRRAEGVCAVTGKPVSGYEIHAGRCEGDALTRPMLVLGSGADGARSADGRVAGCYLHGLFASDTWRSAWLERVRPGSASRLDYEAAVEDALDALADGLEAALDVDALLALAQAPTLPGAAP